MSDIVERLRLDAEPSEGDMETAAQEIEKLRAALREIEYLEHPRIRGMPRRMSIRQIALEALGEKEPDA